MLQKIYILKQNADLLIFLFIKESR